MASIIVRGKGIAVGMTHKTNDVFFADFGFTDQFCSACLKTVKDRVLTDTVDQLALRRYSRCNKVSASFLVMSKSLYYLSSHGHQI